MHPTPLLSSPRSVWWASLARTSPSSTRTCCDGAKSTWPAWNGCPGEPSAGPVVYAADFNQRTTLDTQLNVFETFRPKIPQAYADSEMVFLANIDPVLQLEVLNQVRQPRFVACDTMNFWIGGKREDLLRVLKRVNMVLLNDEEARQLSGRDNLPAAARIIHEMGPTTVVIKRGDAGALLFSQGEVFAAPAFPLEHVVDPTGAGDSFAGGCMGWLASHRRSVGRWDPQCSGLRDRTGVVLGRGFQPGPIPQPRCRGDSYPLRGLRPAGALHPGPVLEHRTV